MSPNELGPSLDTPSTPLADAIARVGESGEGFALDVTAAKDDKPVVSFEGSKEIGKGWSVAGAVLWAKDRWAAVGKLRWKPREK
jgi:hypothetical protein